MRKVFLLLFIVFLPWVGWGQTPLVKAATRAVTENAIKRELYAAARRQFLPAELQKDIVYSIAQVHRPGIEGVLGTAWLAKKEDQYFAVMPYHIGGKKGSKRDLTFYTNHKKTKKISVTIDANGTSGYHSPDVSIARLEPEDVKDNIPLEVAEPDQSQEAYSFGYTIGDFTPQDFLPMRRWIIDREGVGLRTDRFIPLEDAENPWNLSGYCGAPLLQNIKGKWKVVGMHAGSRSAAETGFAENLSFAISIKKALEILVYEMKFVSPNLRALLFKGQQIALLSTDEHVKAVKIMRNDEIIFEQEMRFFPYPYSDKHAEKAFVSAPALQKGDLVSFDIINNNRKVRTVDFYIW